MLVLILGKMCICLKDFEHHAKILNFGIFCKMNQKILYIVYIVLLPYNILYYIQHIIKQERKTPKHTKLNVNQNTNEYDQEMLQSHHNCLLVSFIHLLQSWRTVLRNGIAMFPHLMFSLKCAICS